MATNMLSRMLSCWRMMGMHELSHVVVRKVLEKDGLVGIMTHRRARVDNKERVHILIDAENKKFAQDFGINLSIFFDNCLKELVEHLKNFNERRGWDLNPRVPYGTRALQARAVPLCHPGTAKTCWAGRFIKLLVTLTSATTFAARPILSLLGSKMRRCQNTLNVSLETLQRGQTSGASPTKTYPHVGQT